MNPYRFFSVRQVQAPKAEYRVHDKSVGTSRLPYAEMPPVTTVSL